MKMTHIEEGAVREIRASHAGRGGKTVTSRSGEASATAAGDRQIDEIERTFTLRYEW